MVSTTTTNKSIEKPGSGDYPNTWNVPVNSDWDIIDRAFGGVQVMNPTGVSGTVVLTTTQYQPQILVVGASISATATLTANVNYQIPSGVGGVWTVYNNTSGAFTITISSGGGGTSQAITQGLHTLVYSDGTNIFRAENSVPSVIPSGTNMLFFQTAAPTGWTQYTVVNDYMLRVVNSAGAGLHNSIGVDTYFSGSYPVGSTTLTIDQMPFHDHAVADPGHNHLFPQGGVGGGGYAQLANGFGGYSATTSSFTGIGIYGTGGGNSHTHTIPGLKYADVIICTKD